MTTRDLKSGDWVRTESGLIGQIVTIVQLTAYVSITQVAGEIVVPFLLSELTRIDSPGNAARHGVTRWKRKFRSHARRLATSGGQFILLQCGNSKRQLSAT